MRRERRYALRVEWENTVAKGIDYAVELCANEATRVHVMSMSMGGVASAAWADAVNKAKPKQRYGTCADTT